MAAPFLVAVRNPDPEKASAYECGFNAFDDARMKLRTCATISLRSSSSSSTWRLPFLFPWAGLLRLGRSASSRSASRCVGMIGFVYEWRRTLEWD